MIIDSGWKFLGNFQGCEPVVIDGVNVWDQDYKLTDDTVLMTLPDDPGQLYSFGIKEIRKDGRVIRFGMTELHPTHYAFVVPA